MTAAAGSAAARAPDASAARTRGWLTVCELTDLLGAAALAIVAGVGFHTSFGGWGFMTPTVAGALLGPLVALVGARTRGPAPVVAALAVAVFFLAGGPVTVLAETSGGIPNPASLTSMIRGGVDGWARLLTVIPPAGQEGNLLVVPFETTFVAGLLGGSIALRRRWVGPPVVPSVVALVLAVLWGTAVPAALLLQGCGFAVAASTWMALRASRGTTTLGATAGRLRRLSAMLMIVVAVGVAATVGGSLPFTDTNRFVLRDHTEPPLDPSVFPSPLARWPYYTDKTREEKPLFRVEARSPLPKDTLVRLASMDAYDGAVFAVDTRGRGASGIFVKVSSELPGAPAGPRVDLTVTIDQLADVWLPLIGQPTSLRPTGADTRATELREALRFNRSTRTLILPSVTRPGDQFELTTVLDPPTDPVSAGAAAADLSRAGPPLPNEAPASFRELARRIVDDKKAETPYAKAQALADVLKRDGVLRPELSSTHSLYRLEVFLSKYLKKRDADLRGTAEQYTATMAILARAIDLPARVVVGFQPPEGVASFELRGKDVRAWVEVAFEGVGWVRFDPVPDKTEKPEQPKTAPPKASESLPPEPPPPAVPPPPTVVPADESTGRPPPKPPGGVFHLGTAGKVALWLASIPAGAGALTGLIVLAKRRRRRRRDEGSPLDRVRGAWAEYLDQAKDIGRPVPSFVTRHEAGMLIGGPSGAKVAAATDALCFGGTALEDRDAEGHWKDVDEALAALEADKSRWERWQAMVNLQSFLERPKDRHPRAGPRMRGRDRREAAAEVQP